jgi:L-amino acid N-acyltransferase YncA
VGQGDAAGLLAFLRSLSPEARQFRFFSAACDIDAAARWAASADGSDQIGLVAIDRDGKIVGHATCARLYGPRGEVAVEVDENHRHLGLASILLRRLAHEAEHQGIRRLVAEVLPENHEMLSVFHDEFDASQHRTNGEIDIEFPSRAWQSSPARAG